MPTSYMGAFVAIYLVEEVLPITEIKLKHIKAEDDEEAEQKARHLLGLIFYEDGHIYKTYQVTKVSKSSKHSSYMCACTAYAYLDNPDEDDITLDTLTIDLYVTILQDVTEDQAREFAKRKLQQLYPETSFFSRKFSIESI